MRKIQMTYYWHVYHDHLLSRRIYPIAERRASIRKDKPWGEQRLRLRLIKRVRGLPEAFYLGTDGEVPRKYRALVARLHRRQCKDCPWNGHTIFTRVDPQGRFC